MTQQLTHPSPSASRSRARSAVRPQPRGYRPDIEGLRAVAVIVVVLYHAKLLGVRGGFVGVDVFFVISGFLITRQLLTVVGAQGLRALPTFYTRRIKRLLPAAAVVVIATTLAVRLLGTPLQVRRVAMDAISTTFYGINYRLAIQGTDYQHQGDSVSPLQHFWSLAVEEQFYLVWPILIALVCWFAGRRRVAALVVVLAAVTAISFRFSQEVTAASASWAYFSLHTRAWELALGGLVSLGADQLARLPAVLAWATGWLGLAAVLTSAFLYNDSTPYPGSAAALPVLGATVVVAAGCGRRRSVERVLGEPLMQCLGRVSYSWYLWHWPMLVLAPLVVHHSLGVLDRFAVVWLSLAAAVLSYFFVEQPVRQLGAAPWKGFALGFSVSAAVAAVAVAAIALGPAVVGSGAAVDLATTATATPEVFQEMDAAVAAGVSVRAAPRNLAPQPAVAARDLPAADGTSCHANFATIHQGPCVYGDERGTQTMVLLGDSHADMWLGAFDEAARARHWKVVDWTKSACPAAGMTVRNSSLNRTYVECDQWRQDVLARIAKLKPELVVMSNSENLAPASVTPQQWSQASLATMDAVRRTSGARVVLLQDIPVPTYDVPDCVAGHLAAVRDCAFATSKAYSFPARHRDLAARAAAAGFAVVDPLRWICTEQTCPAVVGNLLVYRDDTHLTATFSRWLAPRVGGLLTTRQ
ncbi:acyltransferase family protein [Angustibacter sp. McL0619]|uniref:acyltransferase family protein n=1 Tax=Angustibacter sp. McL0619 TaxID=3415676 RepID=UPI003CF542E5